MRLHLMTITLLTTLGLSSVAHAVTYTLPLPGNNVIGRTQIAYALPSQTIDDVAQQYDIGHYEILEANPHVNPENLQPFQRLVIPTQFILPNAPKSGIVVNLAELRLYYYPTDSHEVQTYPIAIGMFGDVTPVGQFEIIEKIDHPAWHVPPSVQAQMSKRGLPYPSVFAAGPDNPLGDYALRLNNYTYLIHGTNIPQTIGRRASAGCMHMYPADIKGFFPQVPEHTTVTIVNQPFKAGWSGNVLYFQAHQPLHEDRMSMSFFSSHYWKAPVEAAIADVTPQPKINWQLAKQASAEQDGIPIAIAESH